MNQPAEYNGGSWCNPEIEIGRQPTDGRNPQERGALLPAKWESPNRECAMGDDLSTGRSGRRCLAVEPESTLTSCFCFFITGAQGGREESPANGGGARNRWRWSRNQWLLLKHTSRISALFDPTINEPPLLSWKRIAARKRDPTPKTDLKSDSCPREGSSTLLTISFTSELWGFGDEGGMPGAWETPAEVGLEGVVIAIEFYSGDDS
ncbi:hypothetical protein F5051DRAFT_424253 [Lentinula edodes]|nr:hypothetical protein F5051DRAFT_424253 [Lentinula edodes]